MFFIIITHVVEFIKLDGKKLILYKEKTVCYTLTTAK